MQIQTSLSFKGGTFAGKQYVDMLKQYVDFPVKKFSVDEIRDGELNYNEKYLEKIAKCSAEAELIFRTDNKNGVPNEQFWIMESAFPKTPQTVYWFLNDRQPAMDWLVSLTTNKNFTAGYICDAGFLRWQNEKSLYNYEYFGKSHASLPKVFDKDFQQWQIDVKKINPGRSSLVSHMWLQSAYTMFFGEYFFQFVSKERLTSYPNAYNINELPNGVICIQLYKDLDKSEAPESLQLMKDFRQWVGMDNLEDTLLRLV